MGRCLLRSLLLTRNLFSLRLTEILACNSHYFKNLNVKN